MNENSNQGDRRKRPNGRRKEDEVVAEFVRILGAIDDLKRNVNSSISDMKEEVRKNQRELKNVLFGRDGTGGIVRTLVDLESTVCGVKDSPDSRGLVGDVRDIRECMGGKDGLVTRVGNIETKQRIWNLSLGGGSLSALILAILKSIKP